jgi:uncharacterized membrane protein HdeD (DUF308 family)
MKSQAFTNWYNMVFNGIIALLYGILALFIPSATLLTIITWFGIVILIVGVVGIIAAFNNRRNNRPFGTDLTWSIVTSIIGAVLIFYTQRSIEIFFIIIGIWAVTIGIVQLWIMSKIDSKEQIRTTYLINGIMTLVFGIVLLIFPFTAAQVLITISGILALLSGAILIYMAIRTKNLVTEE